VNKPKKPWAGRFEKPTGRFLDEFGASLKVDQRMWEEDIRGSIVHARMLAEQGIITGDDADAIEAGLSEIFREIRDGRFKFDVSDEDIHMAIERALTERIGPAGAKLHTARSRNDQVATDTRLYAKRKALDLLEANIRLREVIVSLAHTYSAVLMPGYTHMQKAQPILFSHHILAYFWMLSRDAARLRFAFEAADFLPLGSAALAGTTFPIDRSFVAERLGFSQVSPNSMDAVSDRDFLCDLVYACVVTMIHLSRLCEELVLWSTEEFGFIALDDAYSTGSSIMPQKKNPDFAELIRGKSGRALGDLVALLTMLKALPLAYNKDMQEDKEAAFDAIDTTINCMTVAAPMLSTMQINEEKMYQASLGGFMAATDLADHLVRSGIPFRVAHETIGKLVLECEKSGRTLQDLSAEDFGAIHQSFAEEAGKLVDISFVVSRRNSEGGTGPDALSFQLERVKETIAADIKWLEDAKRPRT